MYHSFNQKRKEAIIRMGLFGHLRLAGSFRLRTAQGDGNKIGSVFARSLGCVIGLDWILDPYVLCSLVVVADACGSHKN